MRRCSRRSPRALPGRRATCGGAPPRRPRNSRYRNYPHWTRKVGDAGLYRARRAAVKACRGRVQGSYILYSCILYICTSVHLYICTSVYVYSCTLFEARMSTCIVPSSVCVSLSHPLPVLLPRYAHGSTGPPGGGGDYGGGVHGVGTHRGGRGTEEDGRVLGVHA